MNYERPERSALPFAPRGGPRPLAPGRVGGLAVLALVAAAWTFVLAEQGDRLGEVFSAATWVQARGFLAQFPGVGAGRPAFLDPARWLVALRLTYETLLMSILAIGFAGTGMLLTVIPAARTSADGALTLHRAWTARAAYAVIRAFYVFSRAVPELVWAMLIVFVFSPGILPGALALGLHNFGILGKLCAEVVENTDLRPVRALRAAGAGTVQTLLYGLLPAVLPQFLTYLLYRWEVIIRTTIVVGFVSAGGLGRQFRLSMSWFQFTEVALLLACYVALVLLVDLAAGLLRRLAR